jgi:hypothetical protein
MHRIYDSVTSGRSIRKSLILSLLVAAGILFTSLVAAIEKVDAQIGFGQVTPPLPFISLSAGTPVASSRILNLLTSGTGRWFEFRSDIPMCQIYDFKPSGVPGRLRTVRQSYSFNTLFGANQCQFSRGPISTAFGGVASLVNRTNTLTIVYPTGVTERVVIAGSSRIVNNITQQISVWRGERDNRRRPVYRVWHRSSR